MCNLLAEQLVIIASTCGIRCNDVGEPNPISNTFLIPNAMHRMRHTHTHTHPQRERERERERERQRGKEGGRERETEGPIVNTNPKALLSSLSLHCLVRLKPAPPPSPLFKMENKRNRGVPLRLNHSISQTSPFKEACRTHTCIPACMHADVVRLHRVELGLSTVPHASSVR
jgi:hypothetical protein